MSQSLRHRKATLQDIQRIIDLICEEDELLPKSLIRQVDETYLTAFHKIDQDPNHYLMVVELGEEIVGTCHLTLLPSFTYKGATRLHIEAVRVKEAYRGQGIGKWMIEKAIEDGKSRGATVIQLTTHKKRLKAKRFYEQLGFEATHEGMKLFVGERT